MAFYGKNKAETMQHDLQRLQISLLPKYIK